MNTLSAPWRLSVNLYFWVQFDERAKLQLRAKHILESHAYVLTFWVSVEVRRHWALNANATCWGLVGGYVLSPHMTLGISARLHAKPMHETNLDWGLA